MTNNRKVVKLEEKKLEFEFDIAQAQFNKSGTYRLKLSLQNSHRYDLLPQVLLEVNDSVGSLVGHTSETDSVLWNDSKQSVTFKRNHFKFRLPKGFCKNDNNYDVFLLIEASLQRPLSKKREHVGEARLAIYPRTEAPKADLHVKRGEDIYRYSDILTLLRPLSKATLSMHCGRLSYSVAFHEYVTDDVLDDTSDDDVESVVETKPTVNTNPATSPMPSSSRSKAPIQLEKLNSPTPSRSVLTSQSSSDPHKHLNDHHGDEVIQEEQLDPRNHAGHFKPPPPELDKSVHNEQDEKQTVYKKSPIVVIDPDKLEEDYLSGNGTSIFTIAPTSQPIRQASSLSNTSFHLDLPETPLPLDPPTYREPTMDQPNQSSRTGSDSPATIATVGRSPTITSPQTDGLNKPRGHVAPLGFQDALVMVHGATSLPSPSGGSDPIPFVTLKSRFEEDGGRPAQSSTHASLSPTHSPRWGEVLTMKVAGDKADNEEVILTVADSESKEKLVTYRFPLHYLTPFHPFHLELIQPTSSIPSGVRLFVSIIRRLSHLPRLEDFDFCALEVTIRDFQYELTDPAPPLVAVARIVPDYAQYRSEMLSLNPLPAGVTSSPITFPNPNPTSFVVARKSHQGHPQISTASKQDVRPEWGEALMFTDTATMFNPNSALVVEFYPSSTLMTSVTWNIRNPVGFCSVLLNDEMYKALTSDEGRLGVRVDDLLIQKSNYVTKTGVFPSIRLTIRLIATERPDMLVSTSHCDSLPSFDFFPMENSKRSHVDDDGGASFRVDTPVGGPPLNRMKTRVLVKEDEFPSSDAIKDLLPDYVMTDSDITIGAASKESSLKQETHQQPGNEDKRAKSFIDHQSKELDKYRDAVKRMSADLITLRRSIVQLQEENALLRRELLVNKEVGQELMDDIHRGVISSGEVADKFVAVKQKLTKESEDLKKYKGKVQNLQNQMIKANDREKGYLMEGSSRRELESTVQRLQDKLKKEKKLEETCLQQEKVIQKMEKLLSKYMKSSNQQKLRKETVKVEDERNAVTMLSEENAKLQIELDRLKAQQMHGDADKTDLAEKLRRSEHRVSSLEAQLDHNAREWAKEKHDLTVRLQEHRNGILRSTDPGRSSDPLR